MLLKTNNSERSCYNREQNYGQASTQAASMPNTLLIGLAVDTLLRYERDPRLENKINLNSS